MLSNHPGWNRELKRTNPSPFRFALPSALFSLILFTISLLNASVGYSQKIEGRVPEEVTLDASYELEPGGQRGTLSISIDVEAGFHTFSMTQKEGGPLRTEISILTEGVKIEGGFTPSAAPDISDNPDYPGIPIEEHVGKVTWNAAIVFEPAVGAEGKELVVRYRGQICADGVGGVCKSIDAKKMTVKLLGVASQTASPVTPSSPPSPAIEKSSAPPIPSLKPSLPFGTNRFDNLETDVTSSSFQVPRGKVGWEAKVDPVSSGVGSKINLLFTASPKENTHLYRLDPSEDVTDFRTVMVVTDKAELKFLRPRSSAQWIEKSLNGTVSQYYEGDVTWTVPIEIPKEVSEGTHTIQGAIAYQACNDSFCFAPEGIEFELDVKIAGGKAEASEVRLKAGNNSKIKSHPARTTWLDDPSVADSTDIEPSETATSPGSGTIVAQGPLNFGQLMFYIGSAFLGGFVLNFMPCVLPVIGLKILGFMQEGGGNPKRVAFLNFAFVVGIMSVIMTFCVVMIVAKVGWGSYFGNFYFRIGAMVLLFSMALSFLGVWEIPIPGFANSQKSNELMSKEGGTGAFFKGVLTTLLAIPCTGPFMGGAVGLSLTQPAWIVLTVFFSLGLGMSLPYLIIAIFPKTMAWIPKPGEWTEKLKQVMAFPFLFTVVFFITTIDNDYRIAALSMLIGVWFACWVIGQVPAYEDIDKRASAWGIGVVAAAAIGFGSFQYLGPEPKRPDGEKTISWQPYSPQKLAELTGAGKTVMVDYTAQWCANCKFNLRTAIETNKVSELVEKQGIETLLVDMTNDTQEQWDELNKLNANAIPVLALYSSKNPNKPIVLQGTLLESQVIKALSEAGPSKK